jgi:photosystem II stability/assembly factor-like uncharacterized protein
MKTQSRILFLAIAVLSPFLLAAQWISVSTGITGGNGNALLVSEGRLIAGTQGGISYSDNNAGTWTNSTQMTDEITSFCKLNNTLFSGSHVNGVLMSPDNGATWTATALVDTTDHWVNAVAAGTARLFAGVDDLGVYYSDDMGASWIGTGLNNRTVNALYVAGSLIYAGTENAGVYKSSDNGLTWSQTSLNNKSVRSLEKNSGAVFAGTLDNGVFISTDNGTTWNQTASGNEWIRCLHYDGTKLIAGTTSGLFFTTDNGSTWSQKYLTSRSVNSITSSGSILFAGVGYGGVYSSDNGGTYWVQSVMHNYTIYSLYNTGDAVFAGTYANLYKTETAGNNWTRISGHINVRAMVTEGNHFAEGTYYGAYFSSDGGTTWNQSSLNSSIVYSMAKKGLQFYAGTFGNGVYQSADYGATWSPTTLNNKTVYSLLVSGSRIYAGTKGSGIYYSDDDGATWIQTSMSSQEVRSMAEDNGHIYAATEYHGLFTSADNGNSWQQQLAFENLLSVCVSYPHVIAGTKEFGIRHSPDGGTSWSYSNYGLGNQQVNALLIANGEVYAGTEGTSVWKIPLDQITAVNETTTGSNGGILFNYPNPFRKKTTIEWVLPAKGKYRIIITDIAGLEVKVLADGFGEKGRQKEEFDASELTAGIYLCHIYAGKFSETIKLVKL